MADCDFYFFSDWARDRLGGKSGPAGEPIPLFQLVFNDCFLAGFSGGGYALYARGHDWWPDRTPRLYELMFTSAPAYNWLPMPGGDVPIPDWGSNMCDNRWEWLRRWNAYHRAVGTSEMTAHKFLSKDRKLQRIEFANGVRAELDMAKNRYRIKEVPTFSGQWESPPDVGTYSLK